MIDATQRDSEVRVQVYLRQKQSVSSGKSDEGCVDTKRSQHWLVINVEARSWRDMGKLKRSRPS